MYPPHIQCVVSTQQPAAAAAVAGRFFILGFFILRIFQPQDPPHADFSSSAHAPAALRFFSSSR